MSLGEIVMTMKNNLKRLSPADWSKLEQLLLSARMDVLETISDCSTSCEKDLISQKFTEMWNIVRANRTFETYEDPYDDPYRKY